MKIQNKKHLLNQSFSFLEHQTVKYSAAAASKCGDRRKNSTVIFEGREIFSDSFKHFLTIRSKGLITDRCLNEFLFLRIYFFFGLLVFSDPQTVFWGLYTTVQRLTGSKRPKHRNQIRKYRGQDPFLMLFYTTFIFINIRNNK